MLTIQPLETGGVSCRVEPSARQSPQNTVILFSLSTVLARWMWICISAHGWLGPSTLDLYLP